MKKVVLSLISMAFIGLSACNPTTGGNPATPGDGTASPSAAPGTGTGALITKQDYIKLIDCWVSKVPTPEGKAALESTKAQINAIPDAQWALLSAQFSIAVEAWKKSYATLGCI